jgi:hypothetical protein
MANPTVVSDRPPSEQGPSAPIAEVFPPESVAARFVVSMSIANNDIERALDDVIRAGKNDDPDFFYRLRLTIGHLVEALDSLNAYSQQYEEVRKLLRRLAPKTQRDLKVVRATPRKVGPDALKHLRDNTFHYPSPRTNYKPTSDEQLQQVLAAMANRPSEIHVDFETNRMTLTFADKIALDLAMSKHGPDWEELERQLMVTSAGALAFFSWASALLYAYFDSTGTSLLDVLEPK